MQGKKIKIIELSQYNPNKGISSVDIKSDLYYVASWAGLFARRLKARYPELDIEVWRAEAEFNNISERFVYNGIKGVLFPYKMPIIKKIITIAMIKRLIRLQKRYNLIIHLNTIYNSFFNIIIPRILNKSRIVISHHGGKPPKKDGVKSNLKRKILEYSFNKIDMVTYLRKNISNWIADQNDKILPQFLPVGADFSVMYPLNKDNCREKLGLDKNKVYGIYIGRFYKLKSVHVMLDAYNQLKDKYNFSIIFVGGREYDELYNEVKESGCPYWGYQEWEDIKYFLSAADFYIHPVFNDEFGGFDTSLIEAMACNIPVVSPQLQELDFDYSELGIYLENPNQVYEKIKMMVNSFDKYCNCRKIASQYLDGNTVITDKLKSILVTN